MDADALGAHLERMLAAADATLAVNDDDGYRRMHITPSRATAAPLEIELYPDGAMNVLIGEAGLLLEIADDVPEQMLAQVRAVVSAVIEAGAEEWIAPPGAATDDVRGVLEIRGEAGVVEVANGLFGVPPRRRRERWAYRRYEPY